MIRPCDWCGAWCDCAKCDDPAVRALMDDPATDDPMDADQGGHIHACCDEHELYWQHAHFATSLEGAPNEEILAMMPELTGVRLQIAEAALAEASRPEEAIENIGLSWATFYVEFMKTDS
jgi:hypothetical protein